MFRNRLPRAIESPPLYQAGSGEDAEPSSVHCSKSISSPHRLQVWARWNSSENISLFSPHCGQAHSNDFKFLKLINPGQCCGVDAIWFSPFVILATGIAPQGCLRKTRSPYGLAASPAATGSHSFDPTPVSLSNGLRYCHKVQGVYIERETPPGDVASAADGYPQRSSQIRSAWYVGIVSLPLKKTHT